MILMTAAGDAWCEMICLCTCVTRMSSDAHSVRHMFALVFGVTLKMIEDDGIAVCVLFGCGERMPSPHCQLLNAIRFLLGCLVQMVFSVHRTDGCSVVVAVAVAVSGAGSKDCTHLPHLAMVARVSSMSNTVHTHSRRSVGSDSEGGCDEA